MDYVNRIGNVSGPNYFFGDLAIWFLYLRVIHEDIAPRLALSDKGSGTASLYFHHADRTMVNNQLHLPSQLDCAAGAYQSLTLGARTLKYRVLRLLFRSPDNCAAS
jgi:hypothetical protein